MSWELSPSTECLSALPDYLATLDTETICVIYAEWRVFLNKRNTKQDRDYWNASRYEKSLAWARDYCTRMPVEYLAQDIAQWAIEHGTTDNGGHNVWLCPSGCGCHCVDMDTLEELHDLVSC